MAKSGSAVARSSSAVVWGGRLLAAITLLLGACGSTPPAVPDAPNAAVRGAENGLELWWWVNTDPDGSALARAFRSYATRPSPVPPQQLAAWRANGLRVVAVPVTDLPLLHAAMPVVGPHQKQWLGQVPAWMSGPAGPSWTEEISLFLDEGAVTLRAGRMRFLVRAWTVPAPASTSGGAALYVELVPQHEEHSGPARPLESIGRDIPPGAEEDGLVLRRLSLSVTARPGEALVIVPADPRDDWGADRPWAQDPLSLEEQVFARTPGREPLLGEALLTDTITSGAPRARVVLALVPRVPEQFRLLGTP